MKIKVTNDQETEKLIREGLKKTGGYCPCLLDRNEDTKCMCKAFRDQQHEGPCLCGLYVKG